MTQETEPFEELPIPRKDMFDNSVMRYRIYTNAYQYELVEASSALEALQVSGIKKAYKIERHNPLGDSIIQLSTVMGALSEISSPPTNASPVHATQAVTEIFIDAPVESPMEKDVIEISPPMETAEKTNSGLTNEEVEKLLNS